MFAHSRSGNYIWDDFLMILHVFGWRAQKKKILEEYNDWKAVVYGDEPRENIKFKHKLVSPLFKAFHDLANAYLPMRRTSWEASL